MVRRIRLRGHVIRLYGIRPTTSRTPPQSCPTCRTNYNDGSHRKCYYLCCGYEDCLDCVINENLFNCSVLDSQLAAKIEAKYKKSSSDAHSNTKEIQNIPTNEPNETKETLQNNNIKTDDQIATAPVKMEMVMKVEEEQNNSQKDIKPEFNETSMNTIKTQMALVIPKHHFNPVVCVKRVHVLSIPKRRGRSKGRIILKSVTGPSRRSGRLRMISEQ